MRARLDPVTSDKRFSRGGRNRDNIRLRQRLLEIHRGLRLNTERSQLVNYGLCLLGVATPDQNPAQAHRADMRLHHRHT